MADVAVVVCTCEKYKSIAELCIYYLDYFWPQCIWNKYVISDCFLQAPVCYKQKVYNGMKDWGGRLKKGLEEISEEIILLILDDFIIEDYIKVDELDELVKLMKEDSNISHILLNVVEDKKNQSFNEILNKQSRYAQYKTSLQMGLWRKKDLLTIVRTNDSPWAVELYGNMRTFNSPKLFLCLKEEKYKPINYNNGLFIVQGYINYYEMIRLQNKLNKEFNITSLPVRKHIIRDNISFFSRVVRRIKIIFVYLYYRYCEKILRGIK